jgi:hypothetical protein
LCGVDGVAVYYGSECHELLRGEAILVNDFHLLYDCGLSGFAGTWALMSVGRNEERGSNERYKDGDMS